jgi:hypothetical protein
MSKGPSTRGSYGPTSPRGQYARSMAAPGLSLDMPDRVVKKAKGGKVGSASKRADGCAVKGKTKGRFV